jgi:hypothetical protein
MMLKAILAAGLVVIGIAFYAIGPAAAQTYGPGGTGVGSMQSVPAGSTNGTALGARPANAAGARIYLGSTDSITFTIASLQPTIAPSNTFTISGSTTGPSWDEALFGSEMIYVTAVSGAPQFRWY